MTRDRLLALVGAWLLGAVAGLLAAYVSGWPTAPVMVTLATASAVVVFVATRRR